MAEEPKTLQRLLVEKTGKQEEGVRQQLQELKQKIEKAVEAENSFTIDGFGTFSGENGSLHFEPSDRLENEINQKYAGMQPIELVEAFKETGAGEPIEPVQQEASKEQEEPLSESAAETVEEETRDAPQEEKEEPPSPAESDQGDRDEEPVAPDIGKKQPLPNRRKNGKGAWIAAAAVLIVVILVVGWLFFSHRIFPGRESSNITASQPTDSVNVAGFPVNQGDDSTETQHLQSPATDKDSAQKAGLTDSSIPIYGLHGKINQQLKNAYTIVIHSFHQKSTVQGIAKELQKKGYRAVIFSGKSGSEVHWRVGLGQFKTIEAAQKAVKKLPERYQKEKAHYIHRINS